MLLAGCRATTTRPSYEPLPQAATAEVELSIPEATRALAEALAVDSIALRRIREADGFIDSGWLDARTLEHTGARPLGAGVVRVRAWVNPGKPFWSELVVETSFRPTADPSSPERELDHALPEDHPLVQRVGGVLRKLIERHGDAEALKALATPKAAPKPAASRPDSIKPDSIKPDSIKPDTLRR